MMSYQKARYALWHHPSMHMKKSLEWRETPKSKHLIAVVPPTVLPGLVEVVEVNSAGFKVKLTDQSQVDSIEYWLNELPPDVIPPSTLSTLCVSSTCNINVFDANFTVSQVPLQEGEHISIRLSCHVARIGNMRKLHLDIVDVARNGIPASGV